MATPERTFTPPTARVATFADLLHARAQDQPDRLAYAFLADGESDELRLSYAETDRRARAVAAGLRAAGARPGARAMIVLPPGLDYVTALFGCLYAGVVAVPVYPPDPFQLERSLPRLRAVAHDAGPGFGLTSAPLLGFLDEVTRLAPELGALRWLAVDTVPDPAGDSDPVPSAPEETALLQYTSGSTAEPRGVLLTHANLLHNSGLIQDFFHATPDSRGLVWLPPYHDMGLIGGLLQPLYGGFPVTLMSPLHFLEDPLRWLRAIDRFRATTSGGPNFAYDLCARKCDPDQAAELDLSGWRVAFNGAEPVRPETLRRFARTFAASGFRPDAFLPCYGLAEATLIVSGTGGWTGSDRPPAALAPAVEVDRGALARHEVAPSGDGPVVRLAACGRSAPDQRIAIVDPATGTQCPPDRVGEIWVSGPSVAAGYWGRPEETQRVFGARLPGGEGPFLRTGDLGFLQDGQLVVTGRLRDLIIIRGRNHYPQDIELTAERADPVLRPGCAAAFLAPAEGPDHRLVLVQEVRRQPAPVDVAGLVARIREAVAREHGLRVHTVVLIPAGAMPKTSSGKVQRRLCRDRLLSGGLPEVGRDEAAPGAGEAPGTVDAAAVRAAAPAERAAVLERYLRGQVAVTLGGHPDRLDRDAPLLASGLDSLAVVQLQHRLEVELGTRLPLPAVLVGATLADVVSALAEQITAPATARTPSTASSGEAAGELVAPMAHGQRWMWFLQQLEPTGTAHTVAVALRLAGPADRLALHRALDTLVARHPVLRTTFPLRDGRPVQLVRPQGRAAYQEHDARRLDDAALAQVLTRAAQRPFDLVSGPLLRLHLYQSAGGDVLLFAMHHIITDFWSLSILARELGAAYSAYAEGREPALPPAGTSYVDFVRSQQSMLDDPEQADRLASYWDTVVQSGVPRLDLSALGRRRPDAGGTRTFALRPELADRLRERANAERVTPYVLLLAVFQAVLHRLTGQDDIVVGTNAAGRTRPEFAEVIGCCTNPVMVRSTAAADEPFRALLSRTRDGVIGALEHQDYPIMVLAARHRVRRGPMFDVLFSYNRSPDPGGELAAVALAGPTGVRCRLGPLPVERFPLPAPAGALPIELVMTDVGGVPQGVLRYRGDVLDGPAADRLVTRFLAALEAAVADPGAPVGGLDGSGEPDAQAAPTVDRAA